MQLKIKGIMSYPHLFTPRAVQPGDDPKYGLTVLIRKDDPQLAQVQQALEAEKANGFPQGFPGNAKVFLRDCVETQPGNAELANYMEIRTGASAEFKPTVVDSNLQPVMDPGAAVPGEIAWVAFNTFTYNRAVSKGVAAGLNAVMLTGELGPLGRLDNRPTAEQLFGDIVGGAAPAPAVPAAPQPAAPAQANFMGGAPAPVTPAPAAPVAPPPVPPAAPAAPQLVMTAAAGGVTLEAYLQAGWTEDQLISNGLAVRQ